MKTIHPAVAQHAMEENEKLRGLLRELREITSEYAWDADLEARVDAALSQQAEPADTYTAVDMATAAAQGFRDGQAAVEQAAAQDEQCDTCHGQGEIWTGETAYQGHFQPPEPVMDTCPECSGESVTRPAQTEQQGTSSDKYRAELYDEVWEKARSMGYGNVTNALIELERMKAALSAVTAERDRLATENERLARDAKNDAIAYRAVIERQEELRAEVEALRKDAKL